MNQSKRRGREPGEEQSFFPSDQQIGGPGGWGGPHWKKKDLGEKKSCL